MKNQKVQMLELLRSNKGFTQPEKWIEYGINNNFKKVHAIELEECPDCGSRSFTFIGQFVYYSTLINLQLCTQCGLAFTDKRIDPNIIQTHFEHAYKEEVYFLEQRGRIFEQISKIADSVTPQGGKILDVGGAKGHLLATLKKRRPDLSCVLNDLSREACDYAESKYGFETLLGSITDIELTTSQFDVIILSDVLYYESELHKLWAILPNIIAKNGSIIIRVPNKFTLIRLWQFISCAISSSENNEMRHEIKFFNPEHLYVFSRQYLLNKMKHLGFDQVFAIPSQLLIQNRTDLLPLFFYILSKILSIISLGKIIITPSVLVIAQNKVLTERNKT